MICDLNVVSKSKITTKMILNQNHISLRDFKSKSCHMI